MKIHELIEKLKQVKNQDALVILGFDNLGFEREGGDFYAPLDEVNMESDNNKFNEKTGEFIDEFAGERVPKAAKEAIVLYTEGYLG